ncbi:MAG: ribokinase [Alistipes ihumii]
MNSTTPKTGKILVVGSTNTDMVVKTDHLPRPGETVLGGTFLMNPGGKGANQAVAAARLGAEVTFVCKTGNDLFGVTTRQQLAEEGIDTSFVFTDPHEPSGVALIAVDNRAENTIVVASGANASLLPLDINKALAAIDACDLVLMQLETPMPTIEYVASLAAERGKRVVLNPAPAATLSEQLLKNLYLITPNETEAELITGIPVRDERSAEQAARTIHRAGVRHVIVTLGKKGALLCEGGHCEVIPAHRVEAVDTTAAGDVFNAGLVVALSEGRNLTDAVRFGAKAAAISVTRMGAQASAPYRSEADAFYG